MEKVNRLSKRPNWEVGIERDNKDRKLIKCCDNHLSQGQMITQEVNLLVRVSSGEFTRELDKEPLLN